MELDRIPAGENPRCEVNSVIYGQFLSLQLATRTPVSSRAIG